MLLSEVLPALPSSPHSFGSICNLLPITPCLAANVEAVIEVRRSYLNRNCRLIGVPEIHHSTSLEKTLWKLAKNK